jgi:hypothetical protein
VLNCAALPCAALCCVAVGVCPAGTYDDAMEATLVYDGASRVLRGRNTRLVNFPDTDEDTVAQ